MREFRNGEIDDIESFFHLKQVYQNSLLNEWTNVEFELIESEKVALEKLIQKLLNQSDDWNEDELKLYFFSPFLNLINFTHRPFRPFTQRKLAAKINDIELEGIADFIVAAGKQKNRQPYFFFLNFYKKIRKKASDPLAQLLVTMLTARSLNEQNYPLFGVFTQGQFLYFLVLEGNEYCVSHAYDVSKMPEISAALAILRKVNEYLFKYVEI